MSTIKENTKEEVKQVEQAVNKLNQKVKTIMESQEVKQEVSKSQKYQNIMKISLKNATETFNEGLRQINDNPKLSNEEKQRYRKAMYDKLMEKLYTPKEIQAFQQMFSNIVIVQPNSSQASYQRALPAKQNRNYN